MDAGTLCKQNVFCTLHLNCKKLEECQEIQATEKTEGLRDFMAVWTFRIKILNNK